MNSLDHATESRRAPDGFSLIEVVLAIGIVSFCLLALVGLFSVGMKNSRQASDDTFLGAMATRITGDVRAQGLPIGSTTNYSFDSRGQIVSNGDATAYYACAIVPRVSTEISATSTNLSVAVLTFTWPATVPAGQRPYTSTIRATFPSP